MSKAIKKVGLFSLAAVSLLLASCGNKEVYPELSDKVTVEQNEVLTKDDLVYIYEKLHDSSTTGAEVRDLIMAKYAIGLIGNYSVTSEGEISLEGYDNKDQAGKLEFVKGHEIYWDKVETEAGSNKYEPKEPTALTPTIEHRVELIKNIIKNKVVEKIYEEANASSYKVDNYFYEYKYARAKFETSKIGDFSEDLSSQGAKNIYDSKWEQDFTSATPSDYPFSNKVLIDNTVTIDDVETIIGKKNSSNTPILHLGLYADYINRDIIPDILNTLLVEQYILDNQYTTLSRTQARNVNYVAISTDTTNVNSARKLIETFINKYIKGATKDKEIDFNVLQDAWIGDVFNFADNTVDPTKKDAHQLLVDAKFDLVKTHKETDEVLFNDPNLTTTYIDGKSEHHFYKHTEYGSLMLNYAKINMDANDKISNEQTSAFTNSGAYSIEKGLELKQNELRTHDYTVSDWATKDKGLANLPTAIKDVLFKYDVSIDTPINTDVFTPSDYVVREGGHYYLKKQDAQSEQLIDSIVLRDSSTFYIVEIEDAVSQSKLSLASNDAEKDYSAEEKEEIAREIGYTMASGDTYKNTAYLHYLEQLDIKYHDQSIYDYMLETYPDLFEENK